MKRDKGVKIRHTFHRGQFVIECVEVELKLKFYLVFPSLNSFGTKGKLMAIFPYLSLAFDYCDTLK